MRLRRCGVDILAVVAALFAVQVCRTAVVLATDEEQTAREWLETFYRRAEERYFVLRSASWNFSVNISAENNQREVSNRVCSCLVGVIFQSI